MQILTKNKLSVVYFYTDYFKPKNEQVKTIIDTYTKPRVCGFFSKNIDEMHGNIPDSEKDIKKIVGVPCFHFYFEGKFLENETIIGYHMERVEHTVRRLSNYKSNEEESLDKRLFCFALFELALIVSSACAYSYYINL